MTLKNKPVELNRYLEHMKLIHIIGSDIISISKRDELLFVPINQMKNVLRHENFAIFLIEGNNFVLKAAFSYPKKLLGKKVPIGEGIIGRCAKIKEIINIRDISKCNFYFQSGLEGVQSEIAAPIIFRSQLLGVLTIESIHKNAFKKIDELLLRIICNQLGVALKNAEIFEELKKMALTDELTGLYNYRYFRNRLDEEILRAKRYNRDLSLILIDLDNFKMLNDMYGHPKGDEILIFVSQLITQNIRRVDKITIMKCKETVIARYGGDEFMIILPETSLKGANVVAERLKRLIIEETNKIISNKNERPMITGSFGAVSLKPNEESDLFIQRVDKAMYEAKEKGGNGICFRE